MTITTTARTSRSPGRLLALGTATATLLLGVAGLQPAAAAPVTANEPTTYAGPTYAEAAQQGATAHKPQSKLWWNDGSWWALMVRAGDDPAVTIHQLMDDHSWRDTGVLVDNRTSSTADALWDETGLYVTSRTTGGDVRALRFTYADGTYTQDEDLPLTVASGGTVTSTIARDSAGRLWVTWTQGSAVWVSHLEPGDTAWSAPVAPGTPSAILTEDLSAVIAFDGKIGVMWSDHDDEDAAFWFAVRDDSVEPGAEGEWTQETALAGIDKVDDHLNLKVVADDAGRLHAAVKTSANDFPGTGEPIISVLTRSAAGDWTETPVWLDGEAPGPARTRPMLLLDETNRQLYVFATPEGGGTVFYKRSPLAELAFQTDTEMPFLAAEGASVNNVTSTKQPVSAQTGIVVLASDNAALRYYHAELGIAGAADTQAPTAPTGVSATAVSATRVDLTWTASTDDTAVTGYRVYRDGEEIASTDSTSYSDVTVAASTTYSYTVRARDAAGNESPASAAVSVSTPAVPTDPVVQPRAIDRACPPGSVPASAFTDVPADNTHKAAVECIVWWEVARGRTTTEYAPAGTVSRAQMATFLANLVTESGGSLPTPSRDYFPDDNADTHEANINSLAEAGLVRGLQGGNYGPAQAVTRDQMAAFLVRAYEYRTGTSLPVSFDYFADDNGNTHEVSINKAAEAGITGGTASGGYDPIGRVRRDQMGSFVARTLDVLVERSTAVPPSGRT